MRYLVTGSAGFIAARLSETLLDAGHVVDGVDNLNDAYSPQLKRWRLDRLIARGRFRFHALDISRPEALAPLAGQKFDGAFHLAARSGVRASVLDPQAYVEANITGTQRVLDFCREQNIGKLVLASSSSVYGAGQAMPYREDSDVSRPASPYAASKAAAEGLAHAAHIVHGLDVSVLRYFTVYGPAGRPDMGVFRFLEAIDAGRPATVLGDGLQSRDFTYVDDIVTGTIAALRPTGYRAFNLGGDAPHSVLELIALAEHVAGKRAQIVHEPGNPADVPATWASIERARNELGWRPQVGLAEGLRRTLAWHRTERSWADDLA